MREIGGYFEWEMPRGGGPLHPDATATLKSARSCLAVLLQRERPRKVRVPYYICDGALEPLDGESTEICFYALDDNFGIAGTLPDLTDDERLLYVNYFALKTDYVRRLEVRYREQLWVDNVQAFFHVPEDSPACHFNSARKFLGVPDGAYLYLPDSAVPRFGELSFPANTGYRLEHLTLRLAGRTQDGRHVFQENERLGGRAIAAVSEIGRAMLHRIDYPSAALRRRRNYTHLHAALKDTNRISEQVMELGSDSVPFCYPYLPKRPMEKKYFWDRGIYPPVLWQECAGRVSDAYRWEKTLTAELLPLPIDQRYRRRDMDRVLAAVRDYPGGSA